LFDKYQQQLKRAWMQARQEGRRAAPQRLQEAGTLPSIPAPLPDSKGARTHTKMSTLAENVVFDLCAPMHVASPHLNYLPIQHHILCRHVQNSLCDQFSPLTTPNKYLDVHLMQDHHGDNWATSREDQINSIELEAWLEGEHGTLVFSRHVSGVHGEWIFFEFSIVQGSTVVCGLEIPKNENTTIVIQPIQTLLSWKMKSTSLHFMHTQNTTTEH
jgi:hypothetical protein